jgi:hypothetical protein
VPVTAYVARVQGDEVLVDIGEPAR